MKAWPPSSRSAVPNTPDVEERFLLSNSNKFPDGPRLFALPLGGRARPVLSENHIRPDSRCEKV